MNKPNFTKFFALCFKYFNDDSLMESFDFQDIGEECGLLEVVEYDPEKHGEIYDIEPGDDCYILAPGVAELLKIKLAEEEKES